MSRRTKRGRLHSKKFPASARKPSRPLTARPVEALHDELITFHHLFRLVFQRQEQQHWSAVYLCGQLSNIERKTMEPIILALEGANPNAVRALLQFIGQGTWSSQVLVLEQQRRIAEWLGDRQGIVIVDGSGFPKTRRRFGRCRSAILWSLGQGRQLPRRRLPGLCQRARIRFPGLPFVFARRVVSRRSSGTLEEVRHPQRPRLSNRAGIGHPDVARSGGARRDSLPLGRI